MSEKYVDGVQQFATGTGTGALTLGNATSARTRRMQDAGIGDGDTTYVRIQHAEIDSEWEIVKVTYSIATGQITRTFDAASSSYTGSPISFSSGNKIISGVMPARQAEVVVMDDNGDAIVTRDFTAGRNATVGGTLAAAGAATFSAKASVLGTSAAADGGGTSHVFQVALGTGAPDDEKLQVGVVSGSYSWLQAAKPGTAYRPLVLQPMGNNLGIGQVAPISGLHLLGTNAGTPTPSTSVNLGGTLYAQDAGSGVDNGGQVMFGAAQGAFALIKGLLTNGADNTQGSVGIFTRRVSTDATLTEAARFDMSGSLLAGTDNNLTLGNASHRWSVVYAGTGTINTSGAEAKRHIGEADDAEKRAAARIKASPRKYKFADAVEAKGDAARWHIGYVAEDVRDALAAEGLDPWSYGFMCADAIMEREAYSETVTRPKTRKVPDFDDVVEIRGGKPVRVRKPIERDEVVGSMMQVLDEDGRPVMVEMRNEAGDMVPAPLMHFVPEFETVEVETFRMVDSGRVRLGLRYSELEAFLRCAD